MASAQNETQKIEKKSIKILKFDGNGEFKHFDFENIIKHCVAFANSDGGRLIIGIEDGEDLPPPNQAIDIDVENKIRHRISQLTHNVGSKAEIKIYENNSQTVEIEIFKSENTIASTVDGKYYIRVADKSVPLLPEDLSRFYADKPSFHWETKNRKVPRDRIDDDKLVKFISDIKSSPRVSDNVKRMSDDEILEHYFFTDGDFLTNLGVLWIGSRKDRGNLSYCPIIYFIKYDEREEKIKKISLDDYYLNPKELLQEVLKIDDWKEGNEIAQGMFRSIIPYYSEVILRELVVNALIHRPYSQGGEILIGLYHDRLEISNPGRLPLGITAENILHRSKRRNEKMAKVFSDLGLMEAEGTGIDKIYTSLFQSGKGKNLPIVFEGEDFVKITINKTKVNQNTIDLMNKLNTEFQELNLKEMISFGLIAESGTILAVEFNKKLNLDESLTRDAPRQWLGKLFELELIKLKGKTRGAEYFVNPEFLRKYNFKGKTTLKKIEPHRLKALIEEDLSCYKESLIKNIHQRIGKELAIRKIKSVLDEMVLNGEVTRSGANRWTKYSLNKINAK